MTSERYDLIVVGAGSAGLAATLEAGSRGARVLLLDKTDRLGGMLHIASGEMSGAGTRRQRKFGIDDDPERHLADVLRISHGECARDITWRSIQHQGETIDWLDELGLEFDPACPGLIHGHEVYQIPRTYWAIDYGRTLLELLTRHLQPLVNSGTVTVVLCAAAQRLLRGPATEGGPVTGVLWRTSDGEHSATAPAILLATGGYDANKQLRDEFLPEGCSDAIIGCLDHATGDGLEMARDVGAAITDHRSFIPVMGLIPDPDRPGFAVDYRIASAQLPPDYRTPHEIWVNTAGHRFVAEDTPSPEKRERALLAQPGLAMHIVWDQAAAEQAEPLLTNGTGDWTPERMAAELTADRWIVRADTLDELAAKVGIDARGLAETVARYNRFVAAGADPDFGRTTLPSPVVDPPFYCLTSVACSLLSRQGLIVDPESLGVLDRQGGFIPGLYAAGEILGNDTFAGDNYVGGMSITPALTLGRLVGRQLAGSKR